MDDDSNHSIQQDSVYENVLADSEAPQLNWSGTIQYQDDSARAEFVATNRRLLYRSGGVTKNIGLNHISSVETGVERHTEQDAGTAIGIGIAGVLGVVIGGLMSSQFTGAIATGGAAMLLVSLFFIGAAYSNWDSVGNAGKTIHHLKLIRANEDPLHITTTENVGTDLNRLITEAQSPVSHQG